MPTETVQKEAFGKFSAVYHHAPSVAAYAPGRVEVLGNHTDYNEGLVLSAAINAGTCFLAAERTDATFRVTAGDLMQTVEGHIHSLQPREDCPWVNYVIGVCAGLARRKSFKTGFDALFFGDIPLGAGLSSSAALEVSAALALAEWQGIEMNPLSLARLAQTAEHEFAGVQCGLLDQITSIFGQADRLVLTDFRSLEVQTLPLGRVAHLILCDTRANHALVDGVYNQRRAACERAAAQFDRILDHPVRALRDVSWAEWREHHPRLDPEAARRSAHPIGETERVLQGVERLRKEDLAGFGALMYASHDSSRKYFENSCPELDCAVAAAGETRKALGARLSGGGFGGSVVVLTTDEADAVSGAINARYGETLHRSCDMHILRCENGARLLHEVEKCV